MPAPRGVRNDSNQGVRSGRPEDCRHPTTTGHARCARCPSP
ncbi:hypothetical protein LUTEI9C_10253 [Luteimonas sp. 9C]|nr:hypothetical protein LUTEI9C_10253 [Luteimonas sp. 9C]